MAIHTAGFALITHDVTARMVLSFSRANMLAALLLLASGFSGAHGWVLLIGVAGIPVAMSMLYPAREFTVLPSHFVERHGLLLIIVFGESIIAVGTTLGVHPDGAALLEAGLVILLVVALWLSWFTHDDRRSEAVLDHTPAERRAPDCGADIARCRARIPGSACLRCPFEIVKDAPGHPGQVAQS